MTRRLLITGGAGFIGVNAAQAFLRDGWEVTLLDNLSRPGTEENLLWLRRRYNVAFVRTDIRDAAAVDRIVSECAPLTAVLHLAAQVAVTTSVADPRDDFAINALGTLNVLEAVRRYSPESLVLFSSTNKVYGRLDGISVIREGCRYRFAGDILGIDERTPLDFHSPYGCSKGAADQYTLDYARIYNLRTTSFRQSCIYGPHQFGIEDQGWVAWFAIAALLRRPITIYGDGLQVRDVLHVDDLVAAYRSAIEAPDHCVGEAFNIGGGPENTLSLREFLSELERELGVPVERSFADWRPGDQKIYVSDISKARERLGWRPVISTRDGIVKMLQWVRENRDTIERVLVGKR